MATLTCRPPAVACASKCDLWRNMSRHGEVCGDGCPYRHQATISKAPSMLLLQARVVSGGAGPYKHAPVVCRWRQCCSGSASTVRATESSTWLHPRRSIRSSSRWRRPASGCSSGACCHGRQQPLQASRSNGHRWSVLCERFRGLDVR